ncbi:MULTISPECIES: EamA family transporter RarD [unclassified Microbacterium]|uniref:EamA family transporter RarD n=1 Tax=unclassified Microbacterium TaxID=2609290 RepID=UPI0021A63745|nr:MULTISPECIES: EamA family transporter RarD [unclassified Microbacterium]MCT1365329.1 EamA family transporter RarD [Microbacterium sp. p3-SID131]MCT1377602.1 EamA family transporter RarD [Microbacterium sp. p3-SID337]MDH5133961.1 EamA family transporter RarD [Microbacterium sp. RD10]MDH5137432.1 EamA family transporter RarD [Microbacterium sp. RD11]MDH5145373.1 EamA family transporter RarD [Microbacterium sp. RD12]
MTPETTRATRTAGVAYAGSAYLLWGVLPLYFLLLQPTGPWEVVAWRVLLSFVFCLLLLTVTRGWPAFLAIVRSPRLLGWTALAGLLIYVNWQVFVLGTLSENVVETALGYFINPITTVLLGVFVLKERLRRLQWAAVGIAAVAVVVIIVAYGHVPWIALTLTASFGLYGLIKKKIGPAVDAVSGLTLESFWLIPIAVVQLVVVATTPVGLTMGTAGWPHAVLLAFAGVATAVPLLLFAAGTRRVDLTIIGMLQFLTPVLQFVIGVVVLHEPMPPERWIGFLLVWVAIAVFVVDLLLAARRGRRATRAAAL